MPATRSGALFTPEADGPLECFIDPFFFSEVVLLDQPDSRFAFLDNLASRPREVFFRALLVSVELF